VVALDGMKIAASASKSANRSGDKLDRLARDIVARHAEADAAEDELFGGGVRGDEVPEEAWRPRSRDERIAAALAGLRAEQEAAEKAEQAKAEQFRARQRAGRRTGPHPVSAVVALAEENLARARAARAAQIAELERRAGSRRDRPRAGIEDYCRVKEAAAKVDKARARAAEAARRAAGRDKARKGPGPVRNITDPDSRLMPVRGGFIQGYNAQNVTSEDGLIIATELTCETTDAPWFGPMMRAAGDAAVLVGAHCPAAGPGQDPGGGGRIGLVLADAGYCSEDNLTSAGPDRLIATGRARDLEKAARGQERPGREPAGSATQAMRERLKTEDGITAYRQRGHIAETPHGHIKHNMGFRQLSMRGKRSTSAEWTFVCAIYNLFKALTAGCLTSQALAALAG